MATETIAEFLARGGSVEKSTSNSSLAELLEEEGILNKPDAAKVATNLNKSLISSINTDIEKK